MTQADPIISVIIPNYYRTLKLQRSIQSVVNQIYSDFEILVISRPSFIALANLLLDRMPCHLLSNFRWRTPLPYLINSLSFVLAAWNFAFPVCRRPSGLLSLSKQSRKGLFYVLSAIHHPMLPGSCWHERGTWWPFCSRPTAWPWPIFWPSISLPQQARIQQLEKDKFGRRSEKEP